MFEDTLCDILYWKVNIVESALGKYTIAVNVRKSVRHIGTFCSVLADIYVAIN